MHGNVEGNKGNLKSWYLVINSMHQNNSIICFCNFQLMDEVKILSNDNANLHYLIKEKDQMISANEMKLSELER